jgi:hypothetical protein
MSETINFGEQIYGYGILLLIFGGAVILMGLFLKWFWRLFIPSKLVLTKKKRTLLFLLICWPLLIAIGGLWSAYIIGYHHFYSLRIEADKGLVISYLWPKGEVKIPKEEVVTIAMIHKGLPKEGSDVLIIKTKAGKGFVSTAPVPEPANLLRKIREAIGLKNNI